MSRFYVLSLGRAVMSMICGLMSSLSALASMVLDRLRDVTIWHFDGIRRRATSPPLIRRIWMSATSLNERRLGGVQIKGYLGLPTVRMLTG